jgi:hypothetical protein
MPSHQGAAVVRPRLEITAVARSYNGVGSAMAVPVPAVVTWAARQPSWKCARDAQVHASKRACCAGTIRISRRYGSADWIRRSCGPRTNSGHGRPQQGTAVARKGRCSGGMTRCHRVHFSDCRGGCCVIGLQQQSLLWRRWMRCPRVRPQLQRALQSSQLRCSVCRGAACARCQPWQYAWVSGARRSAPKLRRERTLCAHQGGFAPSFLL